MKYKNYDVSGKIILNKSIEKTLKSGTVKEYKWKGEVVDARVIKAKNEEEAIEQFKIIQKSIFEDREEYELDVNIDTIKDINVLDVNNKSHKMLVIH